MTDLVIVPATHTFAQEVLLMSSHATIIIETQRNHQTFTASGVLLTPQIVLTTAHVVDGVDQVRISTQPTYQPSESSQWTEVLKNGCIIHPDYNPKKSFFKHDIALLFLKTPVQGIFPTTDILSQNIPLYEGEKMERFGYGGRDGKNTCIKRYPTVGLTHLAGQNFETFDHDAVMGDSGGPLYVWRGNRRYLVGLHSTLDLLAGNKTYVVRVPYYWNWIQAVCFEINKTISAQGVSRATPNKYNVRGL
jgi:secreted trypsin-like serine protease